MSNERFDKIESKIDKLDEKLANIDKTLAAQHVSLKEHIRRTEILESDIKPVKKHVERIQGALIVFGAAAGILTALEAVVSILHYFKG